MKAKPYSDQKNWSNTYLTDPAIVKVLGPFDFDPACPPKMPWRTAKVMLTEKEDGLKAPWKGRGFMNPPYRGVLPWARRFAEHGNGIALLNGRSTETRATQTIMDESRAIYFPRGRLVFFKPNGAPWAGRWFPSLLIGMTRNDVRALERMRKAYGGTVYTR